MRITGPSNPFHVARAYAPGATPAVQIPSGPQRLVAGKVAGGVNFVGGSGATNPTNGVYAMYSHPADRNAAATGVALGRRIDVAG